MDQKGDQRGDSLNVANFEHQQKGTVLEIFSMKCVERMSKRMFKFLNFEEMNKCFISYKEKENWIESLDVVFQLLNGFTNFQKFLKIYVDTVFDP